MPDLVKQQ